MSDVVDDSVFEVSMAMKIDNPSLNVSAVIHPSFLKEVDDETTVVNLRFWNARGIEQLMVCRLPPNVPRHYKATLTKVVNKLKTARDDAWRELLKLKAPDHKLSFHRRTGVKPRNKALHVLAIENVGMIDVPVPIFSEEFDGFRLPCLADSDRHNGKSELWVDSRSATWNYISKLVVHEYEAEQASETQTSTPTSTSTSPSTSRIAASTPASTATSSTVPTPIAQSSTSPIAVRKRLSFSTGTENDETTPIKKQTTLFAFVKK